MKEPILVRHPLLISLTCEHSKNSTAFFINSHGYLELNRSTSDKFETCRGERKKDEKPLLGKLNLRLVRKLLHYWKCKQAFINERTNSVPLSIPPLISLTRKRLKICVVQRVPNLRNLPFLSRSFRPELSACNSSVRFSRIVKLARRSRILCSWSSLAAWLLKLLSLAILSAVSTSVPIPFVSLLITAHWVFS